MYIVASCICHTQTRPNEKAQRRNRYLPVFTYICPPCPTLKPADLRLWRAAPSSTDRPMKLGYSPHWPTPKGPLRTRNASKVKSISLHLHNLNYTASEELIEDGAILRTDDQHALFGLDFMRKKTSGSACTHLYAIATPKAPKSAKTPDRNSC